MLRYLGVTTNSETREIQVCCSSEAEAQALAGELSGAFSLLDEKTPQVSDYRIVYHGHIWLLTNFLTSRNWKLITDMKTRLVFNIDERDLLNTGNLGIPQ